jgi:hypothetical protein
VAIGRDLKKNMPTASLSGAAGVVLKAFECFDHPVCADKDASQLFLIVQSKPPLAGKGLGLFILKVKFIC